MRLTRRNMEPNYFQDTYVDIGLQGISKMNTGFPVIQDQPLQPDYRARTYRKDAVVQQDVVEGLNKAIIQKDGDTNRLLIGFQRDGF